DISGSATMQNNSSMNGGAVYLAGKGTLNIEGGTIKDNVVTNDGGGIYLTSGSFNMNAGKVDGNKSSGGNGAGIYIYNGTVNLTGGEVTGNIANDGKGGGFYVAGGDVTLSNGTIASNKAKLAGGGICLEGNITDTNNNETVDVNVNGCSLTGNEATDGNGGGIFLSNANMTYSGGVITFNRAIGTENGVGGGIYISSNSKLNFNNFETLGVYANTADMAADDLFANGDKTSIKVPNITEMKLQDYAGEAEEIGWYEDYFVLDPKYNTSQTARGTKGKEEETFEYRFRQAQEKGQGFMRLYDMGEDITSVTLEDKYLAFALGFLFSDLTIKVYGLKPGECCIFNVEGTAEKSIYKYQVPVYGTNNQYDIQKIKRLPIDSYTVKLIQGWPWAYNQNDITPNTISITQKNNTNGGIYEFTLTHKQTSITHDEKNVSIKLQ
ncbi:MAG: hypothetical protein IIX41_01425, partial [Bacteroidales bacterium]|nr:hypothetical protein [Bacteroidales bacterium]